MFKTNKYRVYVYDTDIAGVVHHSNYLRYFEAGRIEYLRHLNQPYIDFQNQGIGFVPVNISIQYIKPLREDDEYQVSVEIVNIKKASFTLDQTILCDGIVYVSARIQLACVKEPEFKPQRLPTSLYDALS